MLGMHGTYEANMAMHHCDVLLAIGARFDDRVIGNHTGISAAGAAQDHPHRHRSLLDLQDASRSTCRSSGHVESVLDEMIQAYRGSVARRSPMPPR
jgi:acetolactate synthase-1/2/3 large subunit